MKISELTYQDDFIVYNGVKLNQRKPKRLHHSNRTPPKRPYTLPL
jgi:hypothetical protein